MADSSALAGEIRRGLDRVSWRSRRALGAALRRLERRGAPPEDFEALRSETAAAAERLRARRESVPELSYPAGLPVSRERERIVAAIREHQVVIVAGETGSGKTTQLPKMCLEAGLGIRGRIGHTQPRRLAARAVAARLASELGESVGQSVGFKVRFTDAAPENCLVKLMTDGVLLAETAHDRLLLEYDCVIIDEAHERSLNIDFLLGYLKTLLARRPELRLVITSATIDPQSFARHFGGAPVIEVTGRAYPVEVVYLPPGAGEDGAEPAGLADQVLGAFKYLLREHGPGDTLVFLPGERDIIGLTGFLRHAGLKGVEILPLYSRLASSEQNRIFTPHAGIRIILATNVAETSLTVPGIRYVIDPGTARISRYSPRSKVQSLLIERVSRASARQRQGRCGRVGSGVCVRLYSEEDFASRPEYTDPEILRTSLAAVILRMAALNLGRVEDFPFIDAPERRQITDGRRLLEELGALAPGDAGRPRLTAVGRELAALPVDPQLGRMLLEAGRLQCLRETVIIVAALEVSDPRERPPEKKEAARQSHARFEDRKSDFMGYVRLYEYLSGKRAALSSSQWSRLLRQEFFSYVRTREWFDLTRQLRAVCLARGFKINEDRADSARVHQALLSGLLSRIGRLDDSEKGLYAGARGLKFLIHPSSALAGSRPGWICAAELSETSRLFARTAAAIDPRWLESLAAQLVKKSYAEPHWSKSRGACCAALTVTLYGLEIVRGRTVLYSDIDPALCRELFIRDGLVGGDLDCRHAFYRRNQELVAGVRAEEDRLRRRDLLADSEKLCGFYRERLPADIVSVRHFDRWWRVKERTDPHYLDFTGELVRREEETEDEERLFPRVWRQGAFAFALSYVFDPAAGNDGVSVHIPLAVLNQVKSSEFAWQIPGLREELFCALIKSLPKNLRRGLIPAPDYARALREAAGEDVSRDFYAVICRELTRMGGQRVEKEDFDLRAVPGYLNVNFIIETDSGETAGEGRDFAALARSLSERAHAALQRAAGPRGATPPAAVWNFGDIPRERLSRQGSLEVKVYPALSDRRSGVTLEMCDTPAKQSKMMWLGQRRLLALSLKQPTGFLERRLPNRAKLALYYRPLGTIAELVDDLTLGAVGILMRAHGAPCWNEADFSRLADRVRGSLNETALELAALVSGILELAHELQAALQERVTLENALCRADVAAQLERLVHRGFVSETPPERLAEVPRYLRAALERLARAAREPARDRERQRILNAAEERYQRACGRYGSELPEGLEAVRWALEELRVSFFAQHLGVKGPVSARRVDNELERVLRDNPPRG